MVGPLGAGGDLNYPHTLRITQAAAGGTQNPEGGWTGGGAEVAVYDGPANVQDVAATVRRDQEGVPTEEADATAYLPYAAAGFASIAPGMAAQVTWEDGTTLDAQVVATRRLDRVVWLRNLGRR